MMLTTASGIGLTDEQDQLRTSVRRFVDDRIKPVAASIDTGNAWAASVWTDLLPVGVTAVSFPEEVGGDGGTFLDFTLMIEELARGSAAVALMPAMNVLVASAILAHGDTALQEKYLARLVRGEIKACWAFTESATGSDPAAVMTRAEVVNGEWVLHGTKTFISHSSVADIAVIFCRTGERLSAVVVETDQPGFQPGPRCNLLGLRGADTGEVVLDGVTAPLDNVLGDVGDGMRVLVSVESQAKVRGAAMCVGMAQAALEESLAFGLQREHRGTSIAEKFPTVQSLIAEISAQVESARWLTYRAATMRDLPPSPANDADFVRMAATAKLVASQAGVRAASQAMQVHGAYGYTQEFAISRIYRDVKAYEMIQGTVEIQRIIMARELIKQTRSRQ